MDNIYTPKYTYNNVQHKVTLDDAKELVLRYIVQNSNDDTYVESLMLDNDDIYVVWWCYILGGWKTLISTNIPDGMYYEVTYNHSKEEIYLDAYKREKNIRYEIGNKE